MLPSNSNPPGREVEFISTAQARCANNRQTRAVIAGNPKPEGRSPKGDPKPEIRRNPIERREKTPSLIFPLVFIRVNSWLYHAIADEFEHRLHTFRRERIMSIPLLDDYRDLPAEFLVA